MADPAFSLIIPAAGRGERMQSDIAKPYMVLGPSTVLEHTLLCFKGIAGLQQVIISTTESYRQQAEGMLSRIFPGIDTKVSKGGEARQESIYNALMDVSPSSELIAVHDAVRPFAPKKQIQACLKQAYKSGAAILAVPVKDTIKRVNKKNEIAETPERSGLWQAQTPQIFKRHLLINAYEEARSAGEMGTDDASLIEFAGGVVTVVEGSYENFKLTHPLDFRIAEMLIKKPD